MKILMILFALACVSARFYRSHLRPFVSRLFPGFVPTKLSRGLESLEGYATHELAAMLTARLKEDAKAADRAAAAEALIAKAKAALLAEKDATPAPK